MLGKQDNSDCEFLWANALKGREIGLSNFSHLDQPIGLRNYIRIANEIAQYLAGKPEEILDWGCGFGQMTYLLRQRGFDVTPYEVCSFDYRRPDIPLCRAVDPFTSEEPVTLPFPAEKFDVALSCGVLEHVDEMSQPGNEFKSLCELGRVLKPGGHLFIYQLPQLHAWQEAVARRLKLGYSHPRRFTEVEIKRLLSDTGFTVERVRRANLVPKNLTGLPAGVRSAYNQLWRPLMALYKLLCHVPLMNRLAGVMEIVATKR